MFVSRNWLQRAGHLFEKQTTVRNSFSLLTSLPRDLLCVSHSTTAIPARNNKITEPKRIYQVGREMQFALLQLDLAITSEISNTQRFVSFTKYHGSLLARISTVFYIVIPYKIKSRVELSIPENYNRKDTLIFNYWNKRINYKGCLDRLNIERELLYIRVKLKNYNCIIIF